MTAPIYEPSLAPYREPHCLYTHAPSNRTVRGFHPADELMLGDPDLPRSYLGYDGRNASAFVDNHQYTSWTSGDMTFPYFYETEAEYLVGNELVSYPVTKTVYRRDYDLTWQEIIGYLTNGIIPARYPPKFPTGPLGPVNEPMNEEAFQRMVNRFVLHNGRLYERGSGLLVQARHQYAEYITDVMLPHKFPIRSLARMSPEHRAQVASVAVGIWFLDAVPRATFMLRRWSMMGYHPKPSGQYTFMY
uniref:Uncharacterized protein n=1 Tax=Mycena chlorophos TaxID=658473 RepID=A0ABQ0LG74_MYCCL|nr:predicted protein [Mycena chlorophos]